MCAYQSGRYLMCPDYHNHHLYTRCGTCGWESEKRLSLLTTREATCINCSTVAYIDALQRLQGRWTCYTCGRVNDWPVTRRVMK